MAIDNIEDLIVNFETCLEEIKDKPNRARYRWLDVEMSEIRLIVDNYRAKVADWDYLNM